MVRPANAHMITTLDSSNVRDTLQTNMGEHLEYICSRPTLKVPPADIQSVLLILDDKYFSDEELEKTLEDLDYEFIDLGCEGCVQC